MSVGSPWVRVAGGDLCRRWSAEAPTEPAGEMWGVAPLSADNSSAAASSCGAQNSKQGICFVGDFFILYFDGQKRFIILFFKNSI
jgi:hypothetical protein